MNPMSTLLRSLFLLLLTPAFATAAVTFTLVETATPSTTGRASTAGS